MKRVTIFSSGSGTNAENIIKYFSQQTSMKVDFIVFSNNHRAKVLDRVSPLGVSTVSFNKKSFEQRVIINTLKNICPDLIVLAGFLWKIPSDFIHCFKDKIINIHPSLLPKHGGKGMYGMRVHEAVYKSGDSQTGITIHYVNERYDQGKIIFQSKIEISRKDDPQTIAHRVHELEHRHFPRIIESLL